MKGNKGGKCWFKDQLCQEVWCDECQIYQDWREGKLLKTDRGGKKWESSYAKSQNLKNQLCLLVGRGLETLG